MGALWHPTNAKTIKTNEICNLFITLKEIHKNRQIFNFCIYKKNCFINVTDTSGKLIWTKSFTIPFKNIHLFPKDIVETSDGGFLLLCQEEEPLFQIIGRTIRLFRPTVIKTDSNGNEQWRKTLGDYRYNNYASNIIKAEDDTSYFVSWTNRDSILYHFGLSPDQWVTRYNDEVTLNLLRIGESGNTVWQKRFLQKGTNKWIPILVIKQMIKTKDNHIVIGGHGGVEGNYGSAFVKINQQGELIWMRVSIQLEDILHFPQSATALKTFIQTKDGGFVFGGSYELNIVPYSRHAFIMKLDKYGCMEPGCHLRDKWYLDSVADAENKSNKGTEIQLYPNPANAQITIKLPASFELSQPVQVSVYATNGSKVDTYIINDYTTYYSVDRLAIGVYVFKFTSEELGVETIKVVIN